MIFPDSFENKTGFDRIRQMVSEDCLCQLGRNLVDSMAFEVHINTIIHQLDLTEDVRNILLFEQNFPQENYIDSTQCLEKMKIEGSYAEMDELNNLKKSISTIKNLEHFFSKTENKEKYRFICSEFSDLKFFPFIEKHLDIILDKQGYMRDSASPDLKQIRQEIKQKQSSVSKRIQNILKTAQKEGVADHDAEITLREGRPVIPLHTSSKRALGGIVHDESASGKTVFVEPGAIVEMNNEIRELIYAERREIIKILIHFADFIRPHINEMLEAYKALGKIDFLRAKAKFALKINGKHPIVNNTPGFYWKNAVHPLLYLSHSSERKEVVPLDIHLNTQNRILLISGPNAGGKSVCLKTVGLLQYMVQCGMLVPMSENSEAGIYQNIFIDIGDEQSLDNDLSTYSSHLLNMKFFVKMADHETLILIDEFGTGTEPSLGGAIAEAILEDINKKEAFGVLTTHYANLKYFASETPGILNGAMLFDTQNMKALFKLSIGKPGSSFAIDIARNIGLPEKILQSASEKIGEDHVNFEKHLREIIRDKKYWEEKRQRIRNVEKTLDNLYNKYTSELEEIQKERKNILKKAQNEANEVLKNANKQIERTIREIKESNARKERTQKAREELENYKKEITNQDTSDQIDKKIIEIQQAGERLVKHSTDLEHTAKNTNKAKKISAESSIQKGDAVRLKDMDSIGEVLEVNDKSVLIAFGNMITTVERSKVIIEENNDLLKIRKTRKASNYEERRLNFNSRIDVRGLRGEEAIAKVQDFIDDALVVAVKTVRILHGKGNGILRQLIREYLNSSQLVRSVKDEHPDQGGAGITIVELDI
ncbi:MAG: Smr/MutS family protein [Bacteroidales bacterium]|nr:Smr/MutS family protein [Bacteroidales bacterium]